jgi:hypothetical protein
MNETEKQNLYKMFGLEYSPMNLFNYKNCKNWCRFCGARYSPKFYNSSLGDSSLCEVHYKEWNNNNLDISKIKQSDTPYRPNEKFEIELMKKNSLQDLITMKKHC